MLRLGKTRSPLDQRHRKTTTRQGTFYDDSAMFRRNSYDDNSDATYDGNSALNNSFPRTRARLFALMPLIGAKDKEKRIAAIRRLKRFRKKHKEARLAREAGDFDAVFPYGTNQAVRRWNVPVEAAPT